MLKFISSVKYNEKTQQKIEWKTCHSLGGFHLRITHNVFFGYDYYIYQCKTASYDLSHLWKNKCS